MEDLVPLFRERLEAGQQIRFSPKGISMLPMLRDGRDTVVLSPAPEYLKKYDLPLYRRDNGTYVLHRVIHVGETYTCIGDNQFLYETGVRRDQVIAIVTGFRRDGRDRHACRRDEGLRPCRLGRRRCDDVLQDRA